MEKVYEKYAGRLKGLTIVDLILASVSVLLVIFVLFVPYFCKTETEEILGAEMFRSVDDYVKYLKQFTSEDIMRGYVEVTRHYSIFNELTFTIKNLSGAMDTDGLYGSTVMLAMIFPLIAVIMGAVVLVMNGIGLYDSIMDFVRFDKTVMLKYEELKNSAGEQRVKAIANKANYTYSMLLGCVFTVIFDKVFDSVLPDAGRYSHVMGMDKISGVVSLAVLFALAYIVLSAIRKKMRSDLRTEIIAEKYKRKPVEANAATRAEAPRAEMTETAEETAAAVAATEDNEADAIGTDDGEEN